MATTTKKPLREDYRHADLLDWVREQMAPAAVDFPKVLERSKAAGLREINVGPLEGLILRALVAATGGHKVVEIGTLGGYSGHWIVRGMDPKGTLYTCEADENAARTARENFEASKMSRQVRVLEGPALEKLATIEPVGPFDFVFIDADKENYLAYLKWAWRNLRPGGMVALDNAFAFGFLHKEPAEAGEHGPRVRALRECVNYLSDPAKFAGWCMIPTGEGLAVGTKVRD